VLEVNIKGVNTRLTPEDIEILRLQEGGFFIKSHDTSWFGGKGKWSFDYGSLANSRVFVTAVENMGGFTWESHASEPGKQRWYLPTDEARGQLGDVAGQLVVYVIAAVVLTVGAFFYGTVTEWFTESSPDPSLVDADADADADALDAEEASTVYNNRGFALAKTGDLPAAVAYYTKGLQRKPNDVVLLENRRAAYRELGNFEAAIRDQEKVMRLRTPTAQDHETCGLLYVEADKSKEALAHYDSSIEMDPTVASAWFSRGLLHRNIEHLSEAIGDLTKALTLTNDATFKADIQHVRALVYEEQGETAKALEDYESAIQWAQPYPDKSRIAVFHFNRGDLLENMGEKDRALADYNQAIALDRDKSAFFTGRASLLREMGKVDDAKRDEERAKELQPTDQ
jgi:tetratricopeptide (TPR) repeat protein